MPEKETDWLTNWPTKIKIDILGNCHFLVHQIQIVNTCTESLRFRFGPNMKELTFIWTSPKFVRISPMLVLDMIKFEAPGSRKKKLVWIISNCLCQLQLCTLSITQKCSIVRMFTQLISCYLASEKLVMGSYWTK